MENQVDLSVAAKLRDMYSSQGSHSDWKRTQCHVSISASLLGIDASRLKFDRKFLLKRDVALGGIVCCQYIPLFLAVTAAYAYGWILWEELIDYLGKKETTVVTC